MSIFCVVALLSRAAVARISTFRNTTRKPTGRSSPWMDRRVAATVSEVPLRFVDRSSNHGGAYATALATMDGYLIEVNDGAGYYFDIQLTETADAALNFASEEEGVCYYCASCPDSSEDETVSPPQPPCSGQTKGSNSTEPGRAQNNTELPIHNKDGANRRRLDGLSLPLGICRAWSFAEERVGTAFLEALPPCPCTLPNSKPRTPGWSAPSPGGVFHPGASYCIRSISSPTFSAGQQCCYDPAEKLITGGLGAGTPDRIEPDGVSLESGIHFCVDVLPYLSCSCAAYLSHRPPNNGNECPANVVNPC